LVVRQNALIVVTNNQTPSTNTPEAVRLKSECQSKANFSLNKNHLLIVKLSIDDSAYYPKREQKHTSL